MILNINENVFLGESKIHNKGVFALKELPANETILEYKGELISKEEGTKRETESIELAKKDSTKAATYILELDEENDLDGDIENNYAKYLNHSCEPNCEFEIIGKKAFVKTLKSIKKNEELLLNYGFGWDEKEFTKHPCKCGSPKCVGYILDEENWPKLKEHLQKTKYPSKVIQISYGKALIATMDLPVGTIVQKFEGEEITYDKVPEDMVCHTICVGEGDEDKWVVSKTDAICANHSCEPNCEVDDDLNIITIKPVKKEEELTFTYNLVDEKEKGTDFFWDKKWDFECKCKSKKCQGNINKYVKASQLK